MASVDAAMITRVVERYGKDPQRLMDIVREVQGELGQVSEDAVDSIAVSLGVHRVQVARHGELLLVLRPEACGPVHRPPLQLRRGQDARHGQGGRRF